MDDTEASAVIRRMLDLFPQFKNYYAAHCGDKRFVYERWKSVLAGYDVAEVEQVFDEFLLELPESVIPQPIQTIAARIDRRRRLTRKPAADVGKPFKRIHCPESNCLEIFLRGQECESDERAALIESELKV